MRDMPMIAPSLEPVLPRIRTVSAVRRPRGKGEMAAPNPGTDEDAGVSTDSPEPPSARESPIGVEATRASPAKAAATVR